MYRIYKLIFPTGDVYIGSTKQAFNVRYGIHRSDAKNRKVKTYKDELCLKYYFNETQMVEIDNINSDITKEVRILEQKWINKHPNCLNEIKAYSTKEETRIKALEHIKIYNKEYYKRPDVIIKKREYEKQAYLKRNKTRTMSLKPQSIRKDTKVYLNEELVEKAIIIELSESWSEKEEKLFRKMLQQGGKFKLQGNSFRIVKDEKIVNTKGFKDEGIIQIPGLDTKF